MSQLNLRAPEKGDLDRLIELCAAHAAYERAPYSARGKAEQLASLLFDDAAPIHCWLVEEAGAIIGYVTFMKQFSTWDAAPYLYLDCLYLDDAARGKGAGKIVMQRLAERARELGCESAQWQTPDFNEGAIRFYRALGAKDLNKQRFTWDL